MTEDVSGSVAARLRQLLFSVNGLVGAIGMAAFVIGFFTGSLAGRIVSGLIVASAAVYFFASWRTERSDEQNAPAEKVKNDAPAHEGNMKKLLFDDYQSPAGNYVVRRVSEGDPAVVPSSKSVRPVGTALKPESLREMEIPDFFDLDSDTPYSETEPKSEFHSLLNKVLLVLKDVMFAHSVAFFWANRDKAQMVLESMAPDSRQFMSTKRFAMGTTS